METKMEIKGLNTLSSHANQCKTMVKKSLDNPATIKSLDMVHAKKMWAQLDKFDAAYAEYVQGAEKGTLDSSEKADIIKSLSNVVDYMKNKWGKWKDINEYREQLMRIKSLIDKAGLSKILNEEDESKNNFSK